MENKYLASLFAAYITTYSCGISTQHFTYNTKTPKIITSIARYHLDFHMRRFIREPTRMSKFITQEMKSLILKNKPEVYEWTKEFHGVAYEWTGTGYPGYGNWVLWVLWVQTGTGYPGYVGNWVSRQPHGTVRNAKPVMSKHAGQVGISYEKRGRQTIGSLDDYKLFIATQSSNLTKTGQLLFQQSVESYVYCVLGAQAKTRWPIVGKGGMSLQTQEVFKILMNDTIIQSDPTITITNMRKAIKDTNVILNMAISPGMILVPFNMIILDRMIDGYNNILTLAKSGMRFGKNDEVNYFADTIKPPVTTTTTTAPAAAAKATVTTSPSIISDNSETGIHQLYLLGITLFTGSLVSKFLL